jgi:ABC-type branched-subunit amino acid transport system substrate-binding protein
VLLPLSGTNAALGQGMLDAAQMADFDIKGSQLTLLPRDTAGTPEGAASAARDALDKGARIVIGPLTAGEVQAVQPVAAERGVPVLAFSTAAALAGNGTYLLGFLPDDEVRRVLAFAHDKGVHRVAFLGPSTAYGHVIADALKDAAAEQKIDLGPVVFFDPAVPQPIEAIHQLQKTDEDGKAEFDGDALMLPMGGTQLKAVGQLLVANGIDPAHVHFLGTGLWDDPTLIGEPSLQGGWYAAPDPAGRADFERRFRSLYGHAPPRLSTLAYDATALAAKLSADPAGADFSSAALLNPNGFLGVDGIFRLRADGRGERGLAVLEIRNGGAKVVSPAPQTFGSS